jgi:cyanate permease
MCCISNKYILFAGRLVAGFGVGLESVVVPVLLSEIATAETRGTITTLHQVTLRLVVVFLSHEVVSVTNHLRHLHRWDRGLWVR